jgi:heptosyltransferase-2
MRTDFAILLPNWIGDAVMATPTLRTLRHGLARDSRLVGFGRRAICELLAGGAYLDELVELPSGGRLPLERSLRLAARLRAGQFSGAILLTNGFGAAWAVWLAGIAQRIGYARRGRGPLLTNALPPPREGGALRPIPAIDYYLELAVAAGCPPGTPAMKLATTAADEAAAEQIWAGFGDRGGRPTVILNNNAARSSAKLWPAESMGALARRLARDLDFNVLVLAGPGEQARAMRIAELAATPGVFVMPEASIGAIKASIRRGRLMISTDSGPRHIAAAFGVPVVSLFGPTDPRWTDRPGPLDVILQEEVPCGPCQRLTCPYEHHRCMRDLSVERVWSAALRQLERVRP